MKKTLFYPKGKPIKMLLAIFISWTLVGFLSKTPFCMTYLPLGEESSVRDWLNISIHGLRLDLAVAGYLTLIPGLLLIVATWGKGKILHWIWNVYFLIASFLVSLAYVCNFGLYDHWRFPLDDTSLLYVTTSPTDALASMSTSELVLAPLSILFLTFVIWRIFYGLGHTALKEERYTSLEATMTSLALLLLTGLLIIPIRGGLGTGTNHSGSVYFSSNIQFNHAAVNPIFSFVEAVTHKEDIATKYRFMEEGKADTLFAEMTHTSLRADTIRHDYNVIMVCLESFSKYIMDEAGHVEGVTPYLNRYSQEGLYFTRFYANTFRTDRAMIALLSGLPAQPTMSIMDTPRISTSLPSIARTLSEHGYNTHFYYGGDMNYSNMNSYIMGTGFLETTSEKDFSAKELTGKWGAPDGVLFERALHDIQNQAGKGTPFFKVIFTGSSHEPFDVPDYHKLDNRILNAFSYTDECLGNFIEKIKTLPSWENTLVIMVPDHLGAYPEKADNYQPWRFEIPLIMLGGMIDEPRQIATVGAQTDIAATLLGMLGIAHDDFIYSKDLFDTSAPHYAFYTFPDAMGMVVDSASVIYDNTLSKAVVESGNNTDSLVLRSKALLQKLYDDLGSR